MNRMSWEPLFLEPRGLTVSKLWLLAWLITMWHSMAYLNAYHCNLPGEVSLPDKAIERLFITLFKSYFT